jgi:hypothetical protein
MATSRFAKRSSPKSLLIVLLVMVKLVGEGEFAKDLSGNEMEARLPSWQKRLNTVLLSTLSKKQGSKLMMEGVEEEEETTKEHETSTKASAMGEAVSSIRNISNKVS